MSFLWLVVKSPCCRSHTLTTCPLFSPVESKGPPRALPATGQTPVCLPFSGCVRHPLIAETVHPPSHLAPTNLQLAPREDSRCLAGDSVLFSSTDPKPNGFHTFAIVSHVFLLDGKLHKTLTRVPVVAWGTSQLGCCWVAGAPAGPCRCTHVVLPWKSCPGDRSQLLSYLFISKISRCFYEFQEGVPLELPPGLPAPVPPLGPL